MYKLNIVSEVDPYQRMAMFYRRDKTRRGRVRRRLSQRRKRMIAGQTDGSQGNDIVEPGRHDRETRYASKWTGLGGARRLF